MALDGKVNEHHRFCVKQLLAQYDFINRQILELDEEIGRRSDPMSNAIVATENRTSTRKAGRGCVIEKPNCPDRLFGSLRPASRWAQFVVR
jgi:hypothetical protein